MPNFPKLPSFFKTKSRSDLRKTKSLNDMKSQQQEDHKGEANSSSTTAKEVIPPRQLRPMYGFENDMISLDKLMERQNDKQFKAIGIVDKQFKAIGIVGPRGTGKSFICLHLLNKDDVKKKFFPRVFVCMSTANIEDYESKQAVVKGILACLGVEIENKITEDQSKSQKRKLEALLYVLRLELTGKRYLIVLDDVKESTVTQKKKDVKESNDLAFPYGLPKGSGGTVIVTSRDEEVGKKMVGKENLHWLFPIPDPQKLVLIYGEPNEKENVYDLKELLKNLDTLPEKLINKCNGLPLAAKLMGKIKWEVAKERAEAAAAAAAAEAAAAAAAAEAAAAAAAKLEEIKKKEKEEAKQTPKETAQADASKPMEEAKPAPAPAQGEGSKPMEEAKPAPAPAQGERSKPMEEAKPAPAPAQGEASKPIEQPKPAPAPAQGEASKPMEEAKPEAAPGQGEASKPMEQAKPAPAPAQGEGSKPIEQAKPTPAPAQGEGSKPIEQAKPTPAPAQGEGSKPIEQAKPTPAPAQGEGSKPIEQAKPASAPAQGEASKPMEQAKLEAAPVQGEASKPIEQAKPATALAQGEASKPIPKRTEEAGAAKPIEQTKPEQVEASKSTPKQTEEVGAEKPVEQNKSEQPQKETKQVQEESKHNEANPTATHN